MGEGERGIVAVIALCFHGASQAVDEPRPEGASAGVAGEVAFGEEGVEESVDGASGVGGIASSAGVLQEHEVVFRAEGGDRAAVVVEAGDGVQEVGEMEGGSGAERDASAGEVDPEVFDEAVERDAPGVGAGGEVRLAEGVACAEDIAEPRAAPGASRGFTIGRRREGGAPGRFIHAGIIGFSARLC